MVKKIFWLSLVVAATQLSFAQTVRNVQLQKTEPKNHIDQFLEQCRGHIEGKTVSGSSGCYKAAREKWEEEIQTNYKILLSVLIDREKQLLRAMHSDWQKYKEMRFKFLDEAHENRNNEEFLEEEKMKIVRQYALDLKNMYHQTNGL